MTLVYLKAVQAKPPERSSFGVAWMGTTRERAARTVRPMTLAGGIMAILAPYKRQANIQSRLYMSS